MLTNIKSKFLLIKIFSNIKERIKLKIVKHNKKILNQLNISKENFIVFESLKVFNKRFGADIRDIEIEELDLRNKKITSAEFEYFDAIKFKRLRYLDLSDNRIRDIDLLEKVDLKLLNYLDLGKNIFKR